MPSNRRRPDKYTGPAAEPGDTIVDAPMSTSPVCMVPPIRETEQPRLPRYVVRDAPWTEQVRHGSFLNLKTNGGGLALLMADEVFPDGITAWKLDAPSAIFLDWHRLARDGMPADAPQWYSRKGVDDAD